MYNMNENHDEYDKANLKVDGETIKGNALATRVTRLQQKKDKEGLSTEEEVELNKLDGAKKRELNKIDAGKRALGDTGGGTKKGGNAFKDTHTKNDGTKPSEAPTEVKVDKIGSSGARSKMSDNIKYDRVQTFESINEEIDSMRYLIEYMNNNKTKII